MMARLSVAAVFAAFVLAAFGGRTVAADADGVVRPPNVVLIFADDLGYGDLGCYGATAVRTPNLDRVAAEGVRLTDFLVPQAVCSASRAALLTGCYPSRVGIQGALAPKATTGIHADEVLLPELFKARGYATAMVGKWHLGHHLPFLPTRHGFDAYYGLPYSNDMWPRHPTTKFPDLPLIDGERTVELNPDQAKLTTAYTERAVAFIEASREKPFFLYVAHAMPHVPLFASDRHRGKSPGGLYGDVIEEIDWSVGQVLDALKRTGQDEQTLVVFTSDNGPWLSYGDHAGSAGGFREGKGTAFEGGVRVPCVARWPGRIKPGTVCGELASTIDVLPTLAKLIGADLPAGRTIDGKDVWPLLTGEPGARTPHDAFYYYWGDALHAVRAGKWKLHFPHPYPHVDAPGTGGQPGKQSQRRIALELFDLAADPGETTNVAAEHPDLVERLKAIGERAREDLGDGLTKRPGKNVRPAGRVGA